MGDLRREKLGDEAGAVEAYESAVEELEKAVEVTEDRPEKADLWGSIAFIRSQKLGDRDGGIEAFREGLVADPEEANLWRGIAIVLEGQAEALEEAREDATEKWGEAVANHLEVLERIDDPRVRGGTWFGVGQLRSEKLGDEAGAVEAYESAVDELEKAVEVTEDRPEKADLWGSIAFIRSQKLGNRDGGIEAFREGLVADPEEANLWRGIAIVLEEQAEALEEAGEDATEKWGEAVANHLEVLERIDDPRVRGGTWRRVGDLRREKLGDEAGAVEAYESAVEDLEKAVEGVDDPGEKADLWGSIAFIRSEKLGDRDGGIEAFREGLVADPEEANLWIGVVFALEKQAEALDEAGEDATEKWGEAVANHLGALERIDDPRVRGRGWRRVGELRRERIGDEAGGVEAYGRAAEEYVQAAAALEDPAQSTRWWVEAATVSLHGPANAQRALDILQESGLLELQDQNALIVAVRACGQMDRHKESDELLDQLEARLTDAEIEGHILTRRRAWIQLRRGHPQEAVETAVSVSEESAVEAQRAQMIAALCLWLLGDENSSLETLHRLAKASSHTIWEAGDDARFVVERYFSEVDIERYLRPLEELR